jgi:hypothetical protein
MADPVVLQLKYPASVVDIRYCAAGFEQLDGVLYKVGHILLASMLGIVSQGCHVA